MVHSGIQQHSLHLGKTQRLILFMAAALWYLALVHLQQRNFQDGWILEGIVLPSIGFAAIFLLVLSLEDDNRIVALLCAGAVSIAALVPGLKYHQPYGTSIDAVTHYAMTQSLVTTGQVLPDDIYASIAGMHAWLASLALMAGLSAEQIIRIGLPLLAGLMPLLVYWLCVRVDMPAYLVKYTVAASCLAVFPSYLPNGTLFTLVPLFLLFAALVVREFYSVSLKAKRIYSLIAVIAVLQITVWHSTTPMAAPVVLALTSATPVVVWIVDRNAGRPRLAAGPLWFALLTAGLFIFYHLAEADQILEVTVTSLMRVFTSPEMAPNVVPARLFEITLSDAVRVALVIHGRDFLLMGLAVLGSTIIWRHRREWNGLLHLYAFLFLVCAAYGVLMVGSISGAGYRRFIWAPLAATPFFVGPALWWLMNELPRRAARWHVPLPSLRLSLVTVLLVVWAVQFYPLQLLVPKASALAAETSDEYVVWLHEVNSAFQVRMLAWTEANTDSKLRLAFDLWGKRQYQRYFGKEALTYRGGYVPLRRPETFDPDRVRLFLLHWPGPAGGLGEQVEYRSAVNIATLRKTEGWGLIYDNGESFILLLH